MKTPSFLSAPTGDEKRDEAFEEASLRNALERLGASSRAKGQPAPRPAAAGGDQAQGKRRRFVKDGDVQVEKHSLARTTPRTLAMPRTAGTSRSVHFSEEENSEMSRLRRQLADEKLRSEDAERQITALQTSLRGFETRQAHADLLVRELKGKLAEHQEVLTERDRTLRNTRNTVETLQEEIEALRKKLEARPRGRPRLKPAEAEEEDVLVMAEDEPQPVKWWKD